MNACVTLTTDFGWRDPWVAEVKGAIHSVWHRYPGLAGAVTDLVHDLPPGDIAAGCWFLKRVADCWPPGTVHLAVVDPGVGTQRPPLACACGGSYYVGPGNGLLGFLAGRGDLKVVRLDNSLYHGHPLTGKVAPTFHGRDVFAPAAAHLAAGVPLPQLGTAAEVEALGALCAQDGEEFRIVWIDRFGNAVTNLEQSAAAGVRLAAGGWIEVSGHRIRGPVAAYGLAEAAEPFWYWGSAGTLEIAMRDSSAARVLGLKVGLVLGVPGA